MCITVFLIKNIHVIAQRNDKKKYRSAQQPSMIDPIFVQLFHDYTQDLYFDDNSRKNLPDDYIKSIFKKTNLI